MADVGRGVLLYLVGPLAVVSLAMVHAMVQWSRALLEPDPTPGRARRRRWWDTAYAVAWAAILALIAGLLAADRRVPSARDVALVALVVGGFWGLHALLIWFARAIIRVNRRPADAAPEPEQAPEVESPEVPAEPSGPAPSRLRPLGGTVLSLVVVLTVIVLGEASPLMQAVEQALAPHQPWLLWVTIGVAALGFVLLMGGAINMVLRGSLPASQAEIEEPVRRTRDAGRQLYAWRTSVFRIRGQTMGAVGGDTVSFSEMKAAWRARAWQFSPRWRRIFVMGTGALLMVLGLFGIPFVLGGAGMKLVTLGAWGFVLVQLVRGFRRA